jgi:hypothetical protein
MSNDENDETQAERGTEAEGERGKAFEVLWTPAPPSPGDLAPPQERSASAPTPSVPPAPVRASAPPQAPAVPQAQVPQPPQAERMPFSRAEPSRAGGRLAVGLAAVAVLLAGAALVRSTRDEPIEAGEGTAAPTNAPAAPDARVEKLETELATEKARTQRLERELGELELRSKETEELALARERVARDEADTLKAELETLRGTLTAREGEVQASVARSAELERLLAEQQTGQSEPARAAQAFDSALAFLKDKRLAEAREASVALAGLGAGGTPILAALADSIEEADRFEAAVAAGKLGPIALVALRSSFARVESVRAEFAPANFTWFGERGGAEERLKRVDEVVGPLRERVERCAASVATVDADEWKQLSASFKATDSSAILAHSERFGCAHALELGPRVATELPAALLRYRSLDVAALEKVTGLGGWVRLVRGGKLALPDRARADLELLEFAQRWYDTDPQNDSGPDWSTLALVMPDAEKLDWRLQLQLASSLADAASGWPIRDNGLRVLCCVLPDGKVEWQRELALNVRDGTWRIQRERLSSDGRKVLATTVERVERRGHEYVTLPSEELLLDLDARGNAVTVAPYPGHVAVTVPSVLGIVAPDLAAFREQGGACLVHVQGGTRRWYSPLHGLVREELRSGGQLEVRDLVFAR